MKKLIPILLFAAFAYAGDAFNKGYNDGFDSGYCYEQSTLTCSSITAVRPDHFPRINEDSICRWLYARLYGWSKGSRLLGSV